MVIRLFDCTKYKKRCGAWWLTISGDGFKETSKLQNNATDKKYGLVDLLSLFRSKNFVCFSKRFPQMIVMQCNRLLLTLCRGALD